MSSRARALELYVSETTEMTKHRSSDERSTQILDAARKCFLDKGYFASRMDEIAEEAGLSKGGVYFHFDSKRDIFRELVQQEYDRAMAFVEEVANSEGDMATKLLAMGSHFVQNFASGDEQPRFMAIIGEMALRDEDVRQMLLELQESYVQRISSLLEEGIRQGQFREIDSRATAFLLKALIDGVQASFGLGYDVSLEELLPTATEILTLGLATRDSRLAELAENSSGALSAGTELDS
jgi:AcrR family transcriptional regulator